MTPQQAKELLPIITAFAEEKQIQLKCLDGKWHTLEDPEFNAEPYLYRIKPESQQIRIAKIRYYMSKDTYLSVVFKQDWKQVETSYNFVNWVSDPFELYSED